jgi:hypothetical protein
MQRALDTPLPTTPAKARTTEAAATTRPPRSRAVKAFVSLTPTLMLWLVLFMYIPLICTQVQCPPRLTAMHSKAVDATQNAVDGVFQWTSTQAVQMKHLASVHGTEITEKARKMTRETSEKLKELVRFTCAMCDTIE